MTFDERTKDLQAAIESAKKSAELASDRMRAAEATGREHRAEEVRLEKLLIAHLKTPDTSRPPSGGVNISPRDREF